MNKNHNNKNNNNNVYIYKYRERDVLYTIYRDNHAKPGADPGGRVPSRASRWSCGTATARPRPPAGGDACSARSPKEVPVKGVLE